MPNCLVQDRISRCTSAFSTGGGEEIQSAWKQFPEHRSAASICARRRLLDKRSNSLCKEIYEGCSLSLSLSLSLRSIRALLRLESVRDTFPPSRIHLYTTTCSLRVISHPAGYYNGARNGNRQMIHEDVKRDVSRQRFAFSKPRPNTIVVKKRFPMLGEDEGDVSEVIAPRQV